MKNFAIVIMFAVLTAHCTKNDPTAIMNPPQETIVNNNDSFVKAPEGRAEVNEANLSILDLYEDWDGQLICDHRNYSPGGTIYFSEELVNCEILLSYEDNLNTTSADLKKLVDQYITSIDVWSDVQFVELSTLSQHPNMLYFQIAPPKEQPLTIQFSKNNTNEPFRYHFEYVEPFTYVISRPFEADDRIHATEVRQYLLAEETHIYNIAFSHPVVQELTEKHIETMLPELSKDIKWLSNRSLTLTLHLQQEDVMHHYDEYQLYFTADIVKEEASDTSWQNVQVIRFQPTTMKTYHAFNLQNQSKDQLFSSLIAYSNLDLSPDGRWILAEELSSRESILVPSYSLLDRKGNRLKQLKMDHPVWMADGKALLYSDGKSVIHYDITTGEERVIWTDAEETVFQSFKYDPSSGELLVAVGHYDEDWQVSIDLYLYKNIDDDRPMKISNVFYNNNMMRWDGLHYEIPAYSIGNGYLYYINEPFENELEHYIMTYKNGETYKLENKNGEMIVPLNNGKLLRSDNNKLKVYDAFSNKSKEINLALNDDEQLNVKLVYPNKALLSISNGRNYLLDLTTLTLQQMKDEIQVISMRSLNGDVISVK